MGTLIDRIGQRYGRLVVLRRGYRGPSVHNAYWVCLCDCGNETLVQACNLKYGIIRSCGCLNREVAKQKATHGHTRNGQTTKAYRCWANMLQRCYNPDNGAYENYGGRGIKVCRRWHKFENFLADMGESPRRLTLERKDNEKGYCKANCL